MSEFYTKRVSSSGQTYHIYVDDSSYNKYVRVERERFTVLGFTSKETLFYKKLYSLSEAIQLAEAITNSFPTHPIFKYNENTATSNS